MLQCRRTTLQQEAGLGRQAGMQQRVSVAIRSPPRRLSICSWSFSTASASSWETRTLWPLMGTI